MLLCPRCQRANPDEAAYCHFDGSELRRVNGAQRATQPQRLPHDFVFPTGRRCSTYEELLYGCQEDWPTARNLLREGAFQRFLTGAGRTDLARAAERANGQADADMALDTFLANLPAKLEARPRLDLNPRRVHLDHLHSSETAQLKLTIVNQGSGLLHGTLAVEDGADWIKVGGSSKDGVLAIKTLDRQEAILHIDTGGLAAPSKYSTKLIVITNGGVSEVPVLLELVARPFPTGRFAGASTPRDMAERMRAQPKDGVGILESGEVSRWFASNGWTYPVSGPTAKGVAAVQQFFEGMGLSKPPQVNLAESLIEFTCQPEQAITSKIVLQTTARKWVYACAQTDAQWIEIKHGNVSGPQQALVPFEIDARKLGPAGVHEAAIRLTTNGGKSLTARVRVMVDMPPPDSDKKFFRSIVACAIAACLVRLLIAVPADIYARYGAASASPVATTPSQWLQVNSNNPEFLRHFVLATFWLGAILGARAHWRRQHRPIDLVHGALIGLVGGLAVSATLAGLLGQLDAGGNWIISKFGISRIFAEPTWIGLVIWILSASMAWACWGGAIGLVLSCLGARGRDAVSGLSQRLSFLLGSIGWRSAARYFSVK